MLVLKDFRNINPWQGFDSRLRQMQDDMNRVFSRYTYPVAREFPAVNVWTEGDNAIVTAEIPGVNIEDLDISVTGATLTLRGGRKAEEVKEGESYHRRERWAGNFVRSIELPFKIDADKVDAKLTNGILYLTLPRAASDKPKKIAIK